MCTHCSIGTGQLQAPELLLRVREDGTATSLAILFQSTVGVWIAKVPTSTPWLGKVCGRLTRKSVECAVCAAGALRKRPYHLFHPS